MRVVASFGLIGGALQMCGGIYFILRSLGGAGLESSVAACYMFCGIMIIATGLCIVKVCGDVLEGTIK